MSIRVSQKYIRENADVFVSDFPVSYFPFMEPTRKLAYAAGVYGWNGSMYRGEWSGLLYGMNRDYANSDAYFSYDLFRAMGEREREIMHGLDRVEIVQADVRVTLNFIDWRGDSFNVSTLDDGVSWEIVG